MGKDEAIRVERGIERDLKLPWLQSAKGFLNRKVHRGVSVSCSRLPSPPCRSIPHQVDNKEALAWVIPALTHIRDENKRVALLTVFVLFCQIFRILLMPLVTTRGLEVLRILLPHFDVGLFVFRNFTSLTNEVDHKFSFFQPFSSLGSPPPPSLSEPLAT